MITKEAVAWAVGYASPERIDEINILQATYEAMREAVGKLDPAPDLLLNDAVTIPGVEIRQVPIIKGDAKSISIGAASIVAKVTRDRLMEQYADVFPEYDLHPTRVRQCGTYCGTEGVWTDSDPQTQLYQKFRILRHFSVPGEKI